MEKLDIHQFPRKYEGVKLKLRQSGLSERNKELIEKYDQICAIEGNALATRIGTIIILRRFAEQFILVDYDKATIQDLQNAVFKMENDGYSTYTKRGWKSVLRKFFKWLHYGDNYFLKPGFPDICAWINTTVKRKDHLFLKASELITEEEVKKMIDFADTPRNKAIVSTLYELGARISEHGNRRIRDVTRDEYGYIIDLDGKTGKRSPRIIMSAPYLTAWLNIHPLKDNPDAPLWITNEGPRRYGQLRYGTLRDMIWKLMKRAGLNKRIYPHLFRHSRATHCLANGWMNEAQCKVYFGWTPDSAMLSRYAHLTCEDANKAVLKLNGIETGQRKESVLKTKQCPNCKMINEPGAKFCNKCTSILDVKTATEIDQTRKKADDMMTRLLEENPEVVKQLVQILSKAVVEKY